MITSCVFASGMGDQPSWLVSNFVPAWLQVCSPQLFRKIIIIVIIIIIIIIIIAFKGAIRDFFTISSQRHELSPTHMLKWPRCNRVQITCNTLSAFHVQHVVLRATWYEGTAQLLSVTELKSHLFQLYFIG